MRHVVVGTAGHVDHGKTALVKALTGTDTDRFPEEKSRGITIDIGFATLVLPDGTRASVVDVPGHEDFVRNMVAGATGVDVALLVVAADEGVMPQTVEHLAILELLGVRAGVVALTKSDLAAPDWLDLVRADVAARLDGSSVAWEAPVAVSGVTGTGLDGLRGALERAARRAAVRNGDDLFRLPVDRVFSLAGAGTVVTGTSWSGRVTVGDQVTLLPSGAEARVRSIEVHGERQESAAPGRRVALALAGVARAAAERGSVVVSDGSWRATDTVDVVATLLKSARRPLSQRSRVRLHLGTVEVMARVTPAQGEVAPGTSGLVRLRLDQPVVARWGDRAVLRSYSPVTTIGGALVADPWPPARPRRPVADPRRTGTNPVERAEAFIEPGGLAGLAIGDLGVRVGIPPDDVPGVERALAAGGRVARVRDTLVTTRALEDAAARVVAALSRHHAAHPLDPGMPLEPLRAVLASDALAAHVLEGLVDAGTIHTERGIARLPNHVPILDRGQEATRGALLSALAGAGAEGRTAAELAGVAGAGSGPVVEYLVRQGTAIRVGGDRYYHSDVWGPLVRRVLTATQEIGRASPAQLRDRVGLTRKYLIPILEWLDARGWTARSGEGRVVTVAGEQHLSETGPLRPGA